MSTVTLITDFGEADHYVACMKGVILQRAPHVNIVDVTHIVQPHDVVHGAFVLRQVFEYFAPGTIHIGVVDPGVGTTRRLLAARYADQILLVPDNGLVTFVHRDFVLQELRSIENSQLYRAEVSNTFHGRDVFAPIAGLLAQGLLLEQVGPEIRNLELLNVDRPKHLPHGAIEGHVLYIDHFGNVISNISQSDLGSVGHAPDRMDVHVGPLRIGHIHTTYADVSPGEIVAVIGSTGMLEIAINQGNAAAHLRATPGTVVIVR